MQGKDYTFNLVGKDKTKKAFASVTKGMNKLRGALNSTATKVGLFAGAAGLGAMVAKSAAAGDALGKMADRLNMTTQDLAAFQHLTELNGESSESFGKSIEKMARAVGEAQRGIGTAKPAFKELGINIEELSKMDAGQQFRTISDAISGVENQSLKASYAADIFGRAGVRLINTINQGEEGFQAAKAEVEAYGLAITRVDAAKLEAANDSMFRVKQVMSGAAQQATIKLAPIIEVIARRFAEATQHAGGMGKVIENGFNFGVKVVGVFANGIHGVKVLFKGLEVLGRGLFALMITGFSKVVEVVNTVRNGLIDGVVWPTRKVLELLAPFSDKAAEALASVDTLVQGMKTEAPAGLMAFAQAQREAFGVARDELHNLMMADLPATVMKEKLDAVLTEAEARANDAIAKTREKIAGGEAGGKVGEAGKKAEFEEKMARLDSEYATELEKLKTKYDNELTLLKQSEEAKALTEEEYKERKKRADERYAKEKAKLEKTGWKNVSGIMTNALQMMGGVSESENKKMFEFKKKASLAQALVSLPSAVTQAIENGGGLPWGAIPGAITLAAGLKNIQQIKKTKFGGGGSGGGVSASGSASPSSASLGGSSAPASSNLPDLSGNSQQSQQPATVVNFSIAGDVVGDTAETVLTKMRTLIEETDAVLFSANSRQAQELGG